MARRMKTLVCGLLVLVAWPAFAADAWRTFTSSDGRKMEAKILRVEYDFVMLELKKDGRQIPVEFDKLSDADVAFLRAYKEAKATPAPSDSGDENAGDPGADDDVAADGEPKTGRLYPRTRQEIQAGIREIEKRPAPKGLSKEVQAAVNKLNVYRFLCGVPSDVAGDPEFSKNAEDAAKACKANGGLSHSLGHSTDKCNLSSGGDMVGCVSGFIEDGGANNRDARGHRAWCLNAKMGKVGFGSGGESYTAMWCMDTSGKSVRGTWAYPGKGLFPIEYLHGNAWSLYGAGDPGSADKVKVEIFKLPKRPENGVPSGEAPGRPIEVGHVSLGMNAINFEPAQPVRRGIYWVKISGGGVRESYLVELF